jgi:hypothetical protein
MFDISLVIQIIPEVLPPEPETIVHQIELSPDVARLIATLAKAILFHGSCITLAMLTLIKF